MRIRAILVVTALAGAIPFPLIAAEGKPDRAEDIRSGERGLKDLLGTEDLGKVRRRALETGRQEKVVERLRARALARSARALATPAWRALGPVIRTSDGGSDQSGFDSGLVADLALHPTDPRTLWVAVGGGGVWKTTNGGDSWTSLTDDLGPLPVGAIAVAPSAPNRLYAGTGNADTSSGTQNRAGFGVIVSEDGGATWRIPASGTAPGNVFYHLRVDPRNPLVVVSASDKGVYRTTDGGETWTQALTPTATSLVRSGTNPDLLFAATQTGGFSAAKEGRLWKSTNGGVSFREIGSGLPATPETRGRGEITVAPSDPNRVYAAFSTAGGATGLASGGQLLSFVRSSDGGETWQEMLPKNEDLLGTQANFCNVVAVSPQNPDIVYAGGLDNYRSSDGGSTWTKLSDWRGIPSAPYIHADLHGIHFGVDGAVYFVTDGGITVSTDNVQSVRSLNKGLATLQFYKICQTPANADLIMGGNQDNGSSLRKGATEEWREVIGGDGFACLIHPAKPEQILGSVYNGNIFRSTNSGNFFRRSTTGCTDCGASTSPFRTILVRHPAQEDWVVYTSADKVWISKNDGQNWVDASGPISTNISIRDFYFLPPAGARWLMATNRFVWESLDEGKTWRQSAEVPTFNLTAVRYDRTNPLRIWVSTSRPDAGLERVYLSTDGGGAWAPISRTGQNGGLPDMPVLDLEQDPVNPATLWAATYIGVYRTDDGGQRWYRYGTGLPNVIVTDIAFALSGTVMRAGTFGRGVWEIANAAPSGPNNAPSAQIATPSSDTTTEAGTDVSFAGVGTDPDAGDTLTYAWSFGDGTEAVTGAAPKHAFANPGTYTVTLTVTDSQGATASATRRVTVGAPTAAGATLFLPVALEAAGAGGSQYSTEVTVASRAAAPVDVVLRYTASAGSGTGFARVTLQPGEQRIIPGVLGFFRQKGMLIPNDGSAQIGTVAATFAGVATASDVFLGARTYTPDPNPAGQPGTFGLFYSAAATSEGTATVFGLLQTTSTRSNLAVANAGSGSITLRVDLRGDAGQDLGSSTVDLAPYGWYQINQPFAGKGVLSGRASITRTAGSSPFTAYGVLNDAVTSDGSFIPPQVPGDTSGGSRLVPIVLSAAGYRSQLILANETATVLNLDLRYTGSPQLSAAGSGSAGFSLAAGGQSVRPDAMSFLRDLGLPIPTSGNVGGALLAEPTSGSIGASQFLAGVRTFTARADGGTFGLFYPALSLGESATDRAFVFGLQQNGEQRSNLAVVNRGDGGAITLRVTYYGPSGAQAGGTDERTLAAGEWAQFNQPLGSRGVSAGYARVERTSGSSRWVAYGVLNDQVNSDGSYIPMLK